MKVTNKFPQRIVNVIQAKGEKDLTVANVN